MPHRTSIRIATIVTALLLAVAVLACRPDRIDATPVASSGDPSAPGADRRRLGSVEVERLFAAWACPRDPDFAVRTFQPRAVVAPSIADGWTLRTVKGDFAMREADRQFAPSAEVAAAAEQLRASARCR